VATYLALLSFVTFFLAFPSPVVPPSPSSLSNPIRVFFFDFAASAADAARFRLLGVVDGGELLRRLAFVRVCMMVVGAKEWW
jgi:hypothetical protein